MVQQPHGIPACPPALRFARHAVRVFHQRSCAFVDYDDAQSAARAIRCLDGKVIPSLTGTRSLVVQPQKDNTASGGGEGSTATAPAAVPAAAVMAHAPTAVQPTRQRVPGLAVDAAAAAEAAAAAALARPIKQRAAGAAGEGHTALSITASEWRPLRVQAEGAAGMEQQPGSRTFEAAGGFAAGPAGAAVEDDTAGSEDVDHALLLLPSELLDSPIQRLEPPTAAAPLPLPLPLGSGPGAKRGLGLPA